MSQEKTDEIDELRKILEPSMNESSAAKDAKFKEVLDQNKGHNGDMRVDTVISKKRGLEYKETSNKSSKGIGVRKSKKQFKRKHIKISKKRKSSKIKNTIKKRKSSRRKK